MHTISASVAVLVAIIGWHSRRHYGVQSRGRDLEAEEWDQG